VCGIVFASVEKQLKFIRATGMLVEQKLVDAPNFAEVQTIQTLFMDLLKQMSIHINIELKNAMA